MKFYQLYTVITSFNKGVAYTNRTLKHSPHKGFYLGSMPLHLPMCEAKPLASSILPWNLAMPLMMNCSRRPLLKSIYHCWVQGFISHFPLTSYQNCISIYLTCIRSTNSVTVTTFSHTNLFQNYVFPCVQPNTLPINITMCHFVTVV